MRIPPAEWLSAAGLTGPGADSRIPALPGARWQSGYAAACKAVYAGSIPTLASIQTRHAAGLDGRGAQKTKKMTPRTIVTRLFAQADVGLDGRREWDIQVHDPRFYRQVLRGSLGLGESYMDGYWDCADLPALFCRLLEARLHKSALVKTARWLLDVESRLTNMQTRRRAMAVAEEHYNLDHRLYELFLGPWNQYTCCFFDGTDDLAEAEVIKLEMICNKLDIQADDNVLDIGSGWGGFARYAASTRGCQVTGISLSTEQNAYARNYTAGLPVEIVQADYRDLPSIRAAGSFDKVLICGMIEHVGYKNYRSIMDIVHTMLSDDGLFLLHTLGNDQTTTIGDPWMERYIFRNSMMPAMPQLAEAAQGLFAIHDWENYGHYYARTVQAWNDNFQRNWERIRAIETDKPFDERFRRMFNYYFMSCKGAFLSESIYLWHLVMSKRGQRRSVYPRVNLMTSS